MRLISCDAEVTSRQVADIVGISNGSAYYILVALVDKGFVKLSNFKENSRKGSYAYLLTLKGIREKSRLTLHFIKHKRQEFKNLRTEIEALEHEAEFSIGEETTLELKQWLKLEIFQQCFVRLEWTLFVKIWVFWNEFYWTVYLKMFVGDSWAHSECGAVCKFERIDF